MKLNKMNACAFCCSGHCWEESQTRQKIHALWSWPRSLMFALYQSLAIPSPAMILRAMYLLMTLKSKILADSFFFWFPDLFSNLVDILTWMSLRLLKLSKIKNQITSLFSRICSHSFAPISVNGTSLSLLQREKFGYHFWLLIWLYNRQSLYILTF